MLKKAIIPTIKEQLLNNSSTPADLHKAWALQHSSP
jgi:hypothetical protein